MGDLPIATVVRKQELAQGHFKIWLKPSVSFTFEPGQYVTIGIDKILRPYSICSAPHENEIELFLELVPEELRTKNSLTPRLYKMKPGEKVELFPRAKGKFVLDPEVTNHVFVATVTGIAPFISMIRARRHGFYKKSFSKPFYVFQGASYSDEFGYDKELQEAQKEGIIVYIPTVSRPKEMRNASWKGQVGRVNLILDDYFKKFTITPSPATLIYLCGKRGMIEHLGNKREKEEKPLGKLIQAGFKTREEIFF